MQEMETVRSGGSLAGTMSSHFAMSSALEILAAGTGTWCSSICVTDGAVDVHYFLRATKP